MTTKKPISIGFYNLDIDTIEASVDRDIEYLRIILRNQEEILIGDPEKATGEVLSSSFPEFN